MYSRFSTPHLNILCSVWHEQVCDESWCESYRVFIFRLQIDDGLIPDCVHVSRAPGLWWWLLWTCQHRVNIEQSPGPRSITTLFRSPRSGSAHNTLIITRQTFATPTLPWSAQRLFKWGDIMDWDKEKLSRHNAKLFWLQTQEARPWCYSKLMMSLCVRMCLGGCVFVYSPLVIANGGGETGTLHNTPAHPACNYCPWYNLGNIIAVFNTIKSMGRQPF